MRFWLMGFMSVMIVFGNAFAKSQYKVFDQNLVDQIIENEVETNKIENEQKNSNGYILVFDTPAGFNPLSAEVLAIKWPTLQIPPQYAVGNKTGLTTIAYDLKSNPDLSLDELMVGMIFTFNRVIADIQWIDQGFIELDGQEWIYLELTSNNVDKNIHNMMLITELGTQLLMLNFDSTKEEFPIYEKALRESIQTIRIIPPAIILP